MAQYKPYDADWFAKRQLKPPEAITHGTDEDIRSNLKKLKTWNWKLSGNELSCETDHGRLVQTIPPDYILTGEDAEGMPILKKIEV